MRKTKSSTISCRHCAKEMEIRVYADPSEPDYGEPIVAHKTRRFCSVPCQKAWQQNTSWEDRVGAEFAAQFRQKMSQLSSENNPSTFPGVAEKIGASLSAYLTENPRIAEKNPFYGRKHSEATKDHWKRTKQGKRAYTPDQFAKQNQNTPKGASHPNWNGGSSLGEYGPEFTRAYKRQIRESYNFTCQLCDQQHNQLDIHHIDYNKKNNSFDNLIPLCKVCHGKTNYNRESWIPICKAKIRSQVD